MLTADEKQTPFKINMTFPTSEMLGKFILGKLETTEAWVVPIYPDTPDIDALLTLLQEQTDEEMLPVIMPDDIAEQIMSPKYKNAPRYQDWWDINFAKGNAIYQATRSQLLPILKAQKEKARQEERERIAKELAKRDTCPHNPQDGCSANCADCWEQALNS